MRVHDAPKREGKQKILFSLFGSLKKKSLTPRRGVAEIIIECYCGVNMNIFNSVKVGKL